MDSFSEIFSETSAFLAPSSTSFPDYLVGQSKSLMSTSRIAATWRRVSRLGCTMLVHHLLTVAGSLPTFSANHFAVFFCSTNTSFKRLMSPFGTLLVLLVLSVLLILLIFLFLCVSCKVINNFCNTQKFPDKHGQSCVFVIQEWGHYVQIQQEQLGEFCQKNPSEKANFKENDTRNTIFR